MTLKKGAGFKIGIQIVLFCIIEAAILCVGFYVYNGVSSRMTDNVIQNRETLTNLSASAISIKLDQLVSLASRYAQDPQIIASAKSGNWSSATDRIEKLLSTDPTYYDSYIDRFVVLSPEGSIQSVFPQLSGDALGTKDDAIAEWTPIFAGQQNAYVTNVYVRAAAPHVSDVEVLARIQESAGGPSVGYFELQIPTNSFSDFGKDIDLTGDGYAYFVDRAGRIVSSPKFSSSQVVNVSGSALVKSLFANGSGEGTFISSITKTEIVAAYKIIPGYGWGVIARESTKLAFESRDDILNRIEWIVIIVSFINILAFWFFRKGLYRKK